MKPYFVLLLATALFMTGIASAQSLELLKTLKAQSQKLKVTAGDLQQTTISHQYTDEQLGIT
jgi:hypothetical protein